MNLAQVKRKPREETVFISIRVPPSLRVWMKKNKISITKIFMEACKELGWKEK